MESDVGGNKRKQGEGDDLEETTYGDVPKKSTTGEFIFPTLSSDRYKTTSLNVVQPRYGVTNSYPQNYTNFPKYPDFDRSLFPLSNFQPTFVPSVSTTTQLLPVNNYTIPSAPLTLPSFSSLSTISLSSPQQREQQLTYPPRLLSQPADELPNLNNSTILTENSNLFCLYEEPRSIQRKCYRGENRCLIPNPIVFCTKEYKDNPLSKPAEQYTGNVTVSLVDDEGKELPSYIGMALESTTGSLTKPLDLANRATFALRMMASDKKPFRLKFTIQCKCQSSSTVKTQIILSDPFFVFSNKKILVQKRKQHEEQSKSSH